MIELIVARGKKGEIGLDNKLLWNLPEDLKLFKEITEGKYVFMGRKTFDSIVDMIGKPLPNRTSLILTTQDLNDSLEVIKVSSFEEAVDVSGGDLVIIGGATIYNNLYQEADVIHISEVDFDGEADSFFNPDLSEFTLKEKKQYNGFLYTRYEK